MLLPRSRRSAIWAFPALAAGVGIAALLNPADAPANLLVFMPLVAASVGERVSVTLGLR